MEKINTKTQFVPYVRAPHKDTAFVCTIVYQIDEVVLLFIFSVIDKREYIDDKQSVGDRSTTTHTGQMIPLVSSQLNTLIKRPP